MLETAELTNNDTQKQVLKTCFTALMKQDAEIVKTELRNLMDRIQIEQSIYTHTVYCIMLLYFRFE